MSKRVLILVEGQTEERFVKDVLGPAFEGLEVFLIPTILETKRVKDGTKFKGGVTSYAKFKSDARRLLTGAGGALVTTIMDYYGLPGDFPGMQTRPKGGSPRQRVGHVEKEIAEDLDSPGNFIPFLALHEFEAWLFSSPSELPRAMTELGREADFAAIRDSVQTPEEINERPEHAPSKRILKLFPAYKKTLHGPTTAARIGLETIRGECPHFNAWMAKLEAFAAS